MKHTILVRKPRDLTIAWAQRVVNQHDRNVVVTHVEVIAVEVGTTTRVRVMVDHNGAKLPRSWFIKLPSLTWRARMITALPRLLHNEVRFYNEVACSVPLTMPVCLAAQSRFGRGSTLVLADVAEFAGIPSHPRDSLTFEQSTLVIEQLARFHGHFWNTGHNPNYRWLTGSVRRLEDSLGSALAVPLMKRGLKLAGMAIPSTLHKPALRYARYRREVMRFLAQAPQTLIHHDCHSGNLFWNSDKSHAGFLDWQLVRMGEGVSDVAYFLATALKPETRQQHEQDLLATYGKILNAQGIVNLDNAALMHRYRAHLTYAFEAMIVTLAVGGMMDLEHNLELIRRTAAAVDALDAFSALPL
ncbi:MAG: ecdysteroid 22-kinase family protein [Methylococcaceae bacterium]|nr:ecdysteroid 22-kinase family protein [Methylococcaceae bacterium]